MNSLVKEIVKNLLSEEEKQQTTALYAGGFKPPTAGHFEVVQEALKQNPEIDEFIIFIGAKERDGVSQDESLLIWEVYNKYLPFKVKIVPTSIPPVKAVYDFAKNHPTREILWILGAREDNEQDFTDIGSRTKSITNYPNIEARTIITKGGVSGTAARNASKVSFKKFESFVPSVLTPEEKQEVYQIVSGKIQEQLNENASYSQHIDVKQKIKELTQHMLQKGMNIVPLPKVVFKHGDAENAKQFLGKTAYYNPETMEIVLYTEGRHPKDIVRSFSHEMIHHIQNLEDRLGNVTTTNTQEDDHLNDLEAEANLNGTMTFRNWTDSLNEAIVDNKVVCDNCGWSWNIEDGGKDVYLCHKCGHDNTPLQEKKSKDPFGLNAYAAELGRLREDTIKSSFSKNIEEYILSDIKEYGLLPEYKIDINDTYDYSQQGDFFIFHDEINNVDIVSKIKFLPKDIIEFKFYPTKNNEILGFIRLPNPNPKIMNTIFKIFIDEILPKYPKILIQPSDYTRYRLFRAMLNNTLDGNQYKVDTKDDPIGQSSLLIQNFQQQTLEENSKSQYIIYCDMDSVLVDFDRGYQELAGMTTQQADAKGVEAFWDPISKAGAKFWITLKWMPDGKQLWDYIKKYNPILLSAPSREESSKLGKRVWVKRELPGVKLILRYASQKQEYASPTSILIDDRQKNIDQWEAAGGIGILHTSTANTIEQLKQLGL